MSYYLTKQCLSEALREKLGTKTELPLAVALSMNPHLLEDMEVEVERKASRGGSNQFEYLSGNVFAKYDIRWALRDEDVDLLESVLNGVTSTAATGMFAYVVGGVPMAPTAAAAAIASVFIFLRKVIRKKVTLTPLQQELLRCMRARNETGVTVEELEAWLDWAGCRTTGENLQAALESLKEMRLPGGTLIAIANRDQAGRWSTCDV